MSRSSKRPVEAPEGRYFALPHSVLDSASWGRCSPDARALLLELCRQHNGTNNGHMHLTRTWLAKRGWRSPPTVNRLRDELICNRLIVQTRHGGLRHGAHNFALTWLPITDWRDLYLTPRDYHPGAYRLDPLQPSPRKKNGRTAGIREKLPARIPGVHGETPARTTGVRVEVVSDPAPRIPAVHNEYCHSLRANEDELQGVCGPTEVQA